MNIRIKKQKNVDVRKHPRFFVINDVFYTSSQITIFYEYQNGYRKILHHFQILFYPIFPIKAIPLHPEKTKNK